MNRKSNVGHSTISRNKNPLENMPAGMNDVLEKVKEFVAEDEEVQDVPKKPASREIRNLVLFGKITEEFDVGGYSFKLSTLTNRQNKSLIRRLVKVNNEERLTNIKTFTLVEAIVSVDGVPLEDLCEDDISDVWERKHEVILDFQSNLVEILFKHYESIVEKSNKLFNNSEMESEIKN